MSDQTRQLSPDEAAQVIKAAVDIKEDVKAVEQYKELAQESATEIANEVQKITKDRRQHLTLAIVQACVNAVIFMAIAVQAWQLFVQNDKIEDSVTLAEKSIGLTKESIELTRKELTLTRSSARIAVLQQLRSDNEDLSAMINSSPILQKLHQADPYCQDNAPLDPIDQLFFYRILGHYELYFQITSELGMNQEWEVICNAGRVVMQQDCHLGNRLGKILRNVNFAFRRGFEKCEFPASASP